jgi:hypothetical protein
MSGSIIHILQMYWNGVRPLRASSFSHHCIFVEVRIDLPMGVVLLAFEGGFLDRAAYPLDLAIGPRVLDLGEPVLDSVLFVPQVEKGAALPLMRSNKTALSSSMAARMASRWVMVSRHSTYAGLWFYRDSVKMN